MPHSFIQFRQSFNSSDTWYKEDTSLMSVIYLWWGCILLNRSQILYCSLAWRCAGFNTTCLFYMLPQTLGPHSLGARRLEQAQEAWEPRLASLLVPCWGGGIRLHLTSPEHQDLSDWPSARSRSLTHSQALTLRLRGSWWSLIKRKPVWSRGNPCLVPARSRQ